MSPRIPHPPRAGFTLVELLVALGVLALVLTAILQITTGSLNTWRQADGRFQNFVIARSVLELMAGDFENNVIGANIGNVAELSTTDSLRFFTRRLGMDAPGGGALRPFSVVSYAAENGSLWREERAFGWDDRSGFGATIPSPSQSASICDGVLAFRFAFPDGSGGYSRQIPADEPPRAVMLSMAVVGQDAYRLLQDSGKLAAVEETLNTLAEPNEANAVHAWNTWLAGAPDLPGEVRANLRFFQRVFPLPTNRLASAP